jgi:hypothetical protein
MMPPVPSNRLADERSDRFWPLGKYQRLQFVGETLRIILLALAGLRVFPIMRTACVQDAIERQVKSVVEKRKAGQASGH